MAYFRSNLFSLFANNTPDDNLRMILCGNGLCAEIEPRE